MELKRKQEEEERKKREEVERRLQVRLGISSSSAAHLIVHFCNGCWFLFWDCEWALVQTHTAPRFRSLMFVIVTAPSRLFRPFTTAFHKTLLFCVKTLLFVFSHFKAPERHPFARGLFVVGLLCTSCLVLIFMTPQLEPEQDIGHALKSTAYSALIRRNENQIQAESVNRAVSRGYNICPNVLTDIITQPPLVF